MSAHARTFKMPPGSVGANHHAERKFTQLMHEMGSTTGDWNPEPDGHITGFLRKDVNPSPNEIKLINCVKSCCTRKKTGGRTAWGKVNGEPLKLTQIKDLLNWDISNAAKHAKRPLAWGFVRVNEDGVFGTGAAEVSVSGRVKPELKPLGEEKAKDLNSLVCTYQLPQYVADELKGLSPEQAEIFVTEWVRRHELAKKRQAEAMAAERQREFEDKNELCKAFGSELRKREKLAKKPQASTPQNSEQRTPAEDDFHRYVHTSAEIEPEQFVQTTGAGLYGPEKQSVQTDVSLLSSFEVLSSELASSDEQEKEAKSPQQIDDEVIPESAVAEQPESRPSDLEEAVYESLHRSRLEIVGNKKVDRRTIGNICSHLERLQQIPEVKEVLEILEDKCRSLAQRPGEAQGKTWGWVVGVVRGEVNQRVGEPTDLRSALAELATRKVLR